MKKIFKKILVFVQTFVLSFAFLPFSATTKTFAAHSFEGMGTIVYPYQITTAEQLAEIATLVLNGETFEGKLFRVKNDIDLSSYLENEGNNGGAGWQPIGTETKPFMGQFDGDYHKITGLWINRPLENNVGLFGRVENGKIENLGVELSQTQGEISINGGDRTGGLAGNNTNGTILNCYSTGNAEKISGLDEVGGLVGENTTGIITNCHSSLNCESRTSSSGGLVGHSRENTTIDNCYSTGKITTNYLTDNTKGNNTGGFIGNCANSKVINCFSTGNAFSNNARSGGFAGIISSSIVSKCYSTGNASGTSNCGGFAGAIGSAGAIDDGATITDCYATGEVTHTEGYTGGFVGSFDADSYLERCYSTSKVNGPTTNTVGGFIGRSYSEEGSNITACYFNIDTTPLLSAIGWSFFAGVADVTGKNTAEMKDKGTFADWNISDLSSETQNTWKINVSYPFFERSLVRSFDPHHFSYDPNNESKKSVTVFGELPDSNRNLPGSNAANLSRWDQILYNGNSERPTDPGVYDVSARCNLQTQLFVGRTNFIDLGQMKITAQADCYNYDGNKLNTDYRVIPGDQISKAPPLEKPGYDFLGYFDSPLDTTKITNPPVSETGGLPDIKQIDQTQGNKLGVIPQLNSQNKIPLYARFTSNALTNYNKTKPGAFIYAPKGLYPNGSTINTHVYEPGTTEYNEKLADIDEETKAKMEDQRLTIVEFTVLGPDGITKVDPDPFFVGATKLKIAFAVPNDYDFTEKNLEISLVNPGQGNDTIYPEKLWTDPNGTHYAIAEVDHLTPYALVDVLSESTSLPQKTGDKRLTSNLMVGIIAIFYTGIYFFLKKRDKLNF